MRFRWEHLAAVAAAILVLMATWFSVPIFHVTGTNAIVLRIGILLLGIIAIIGFLVWVHSKHPSLPVTEDRPAQSSSAASAGAAQDVDILIKEASNKVAAARLAAGAKLFALPTVFLLGESGAGKTSAMDQSGLDAELLSGQVYQESSVIPTRVANLWFARKTVFVEAGGPLMDDAFSWVRLIKHFLPGALRSLFGGGGSVPRAAVVCVDCEKLVREAALDKIVAQAQKLRARLEELSYHLGISLPVYVLFNRADRIPYFDEFSGTFGTEETSQVLGATLPLVGATSSGVYAEQETRRLNAAFQSIFFSLAECRPGLLSRERNPERQAGVYEFPREFGKLSKPLVQFLVDLCRPGHLRTGPFLRGFYFVGQRVVTVSAGAQTMLGTRLSPQRAPGGFNPDATSLINAQDSAAKTSWASGTSFESAGESRKSIQRMFLSHVFSHVLLQDRAALGASGKSTRGDFGRRVLFICLALIALVWIIVTAVSFGGNASLVASVRDAARDLSTVQNVGAQAPTVDSLRRLDALRQTLLELRRYQQDGAPTRLRWGLYTADSDFFNDARAIYFHAFHQILFDHTQKNLLLDLRSYKGDPQASADSGSAYDALKAYLLTTSEYQRNSGDFLADFLMKEWKKDLGDLDHDHTDIAAQHFAFYSSELTRGNPFSKEDDPGLVAQVRAYLNRLAGPQRIYLSMLANARQQTKDYRFATQHPESLPVMRAPVDVSGAFTSDGWKLMDSYIQDSRKFVQGEPWVLGAATGVDLSAADLSNSLRSLYEKDFLAQWRGFLHAANVLSYSSESDAASKLQVLSSNSSPLLALICDVSDNTNTQSAAVKVAFQAPQQVVTPGCGAQKKYDQPSNDPYMRGLLNLQQCVQQTAGAAPDQKDTLKNNCLQTAAQAHLAAAQIAQTFPTDPDGHVDQAVGALLDEPIKAIQRLWAARAGGSSAGLCKPFNNLKAAYPINARATRELTLPEFNQFFQPKTGILAAYLASQKSTLSLQGNQYISALGSTTPVGRNTLHFINALYAIQLAVYPSNATDPHFEYLVTARLPDAGGFKNEKLAFDGQEWTITGGGGTKKFVWPGSVVQGASLSLNNGGGDLEVNSAQGLWAVAKFFSGYNWTPSGNGYIIQGPLRNPAGNPMTSNGKPVELRFDVDMKGAPLFQAGYLSNLSCPPKMSQ